MRSPSAASTRSLGLALVCCLLAQGGPAHGRPAATDPARAGAPARPGEAHGRDGRKVKAGARWLSRQITRLNQGLHLGSGLRAARERFMGSRAGQKLRRLQRKTHRAVLLARGELTHSADRLQRRLSPKRARLFSRLRSVNPLSLGAYSLYKFKKDPVFLGSYKGFSWVFGKLGPPALLKLGAGVTTSLLLPGLIGVPMDLGFIVGREHHLRRKQNPNQTLRGTLRDLGAEYRGFVQHRREQNRRYHQVRARATVE